MILRKIESRQDAPSTSVTYIDGPLFLALLVHASVTSSTSVSDVSRRIDASGSVGSPSPDHKMRSSRVLVNECISSIALNVYVCGDKVAQLLSSLTVREDSESQDDRADRDGSIGAEERSRVVDCFYVFLDFLVSLSDILRKIVDNQSRPIMKFDHGGNQSEVYYS